MFDEIVLAKAFFDREGLLLALEDESAVGLAHAGFGPTSELAGFNAAIGVVSQVLVRPGQPESLAAELLMRAEDFLRRRGSRTFIAGGVAGRDPFYSGLAGGSESRGLLASDTARLAMFSAAGYQPGTRCAVLHRDLTRFRPPVDRAQMQLRRRMCVETITDPAAANWWDAITLGNFERLRYDLRLRGVAREAATMTFWMMTPFSTSWGVHAAGLIDFQVAAQDRRQGMATFLMSEALRQLLAQGISLVEAQVDLSNVPATQLFAKLGFEQVDDATEYAKTA